jgi:hypothetical protein
MELARIRFHGSMIFHSRGLRCVIPCATTGRFTSRPPLGASQTRADVHYHLRSRRKTANDGAKTTRPANRRRRKKPSPPPTTRPPHVSEQTRPRQRRGHACSSRSRERRRGRRSRRRRRKSRDHVRGSTRLLLSLPVYNFRVSKPSALSLDKATIVSCSLGAVPVARERSLADATVTVLFRSPLQQGRPWLQPATLPSTAIVCHVTFVAVT